MCCEIGVVQKSCDVVGSWETREIDIDLKESGIVQWQSKGYILELGIVLYSLGYYMAILQN